MKVAAEFWFLIIIFFNLGHSRVDIQKGYRITLAVPTYYSEGFIGRAFLIESDVLLAPSFRAALAVEASGGIYSCSLQVFLGEVKVWSSGHFSKFYTLDKCVLEFNGDGDLRIKGPTELVGWRTGTSGQGVEKLKILSSGNLALVDGMERIKWQSFNFPTDVMLWGQSLNVATDLTSFPRNSTTFYSFEIETEKIALYLNSGKLKYSYWEFKPSNDINISYIKLESQGLSIYDDQGKKIAEIPSQTAQPLRFLALGNKTGNLGLYAYSPEKGVFEAAFRALNTTCDLPLACKPYGICTFSNSCSCIKLQMENEGIDSKCDEEKNGKFCGQSEADMLELEGISSILRDAPKRVNISKEECSDMCLKDCKCAAVMYSSSGLGGDGRQKECFLYGVVMGVKQIEKGMDLSFLVKVPKGSNLGNEKSKLKKWIIVLVGVVDGLIILLICGGLGYYLIKRRRKNLMDRDTHS